MKNNIHFIIKSLRNRCVIERFVLSLFYFD